MTLDRRKLFLLPFIGIVIFISIAFIILDFTLKGWFFERNESEVIRVIDATADSIVRINASDDDMQLIAENIGSVAKHYQITVIDKNGIILGDSYLEILYSLERVVNVAEYKEYIDAVEHGIGRSIRFDYRDNVELLHIAKRFEHNGTPYYIRVSMKTEDYRQAMESLRKFLLMMAGGLLVLVTLFLLVFSRFLNQSIKTGQDLLENRVNERTQEILLLQRLSSLLAACKFISEIEDVLKDIVPRIVGDIPCAITVVNSSRNLVELKMQWGCQWPGEAVFSPEECWALRKGNYHFSKDALSSQNCIHMPSTPDNTLCIPLLAHGQTLGAFHLIVGDSFSDESRGLAFTIAEHTGLALANLSLQETLRNQAARDPLTGLYNRRHLEKSLELELNRTERHKASCALLMLDIDHFKKFNDNFGHDAGDYVLKTLAKLLQELIRKEDTVCRIGGEEIAIILPETNAQKASTCADKICEAVSEQHLSFNGISLGSLTVSIGVAIFPNNAHDYASLVKAADIELYKVKNNGRNNYSIAT